MDKKFLSTMMVALTLAATLAGTAIAAPAINFKDVNNHWAQNAITQAVSDGYVNGYANGTFKPNGAVTRAEFASIVTRAFDLPDLGKTANFTDVTSKHWANSAINDAVRMGVINPNDYGTKFNPNTLMTRYEMANWFKNALVANGQGYDKAYAELEGTIVPVVEYYKGGLSKTQLKVAGLMVGTGIIGGDTAGKFNPNANVTRAEMVSMLYRYIAVESKQADTILGLNEMREVALTGTNIESIGTVQNGTNQTYTSIGDIINSKDKLQGKNGVGTVQLNHYIVIDNYNNAPKSVYSKMFKVTSETNYKSNRFTVWSDVTFTPSKNLTSTSNFSAAVPAVTFTVVNGIKGPEVYGIKIIPADASILKKGATLRYWTTGSLEIGAPQIINGAPSDFFLVYAFNK